MPRLTRLAAPLFALALAACNTSAGVYSGGDVGVAVGASAGTTTTAAFNARPTRPYACGSMSAAPAVWVGSFRGSREVEYGFMRREETAQQACFVSERECRNWLYNMQSTYREMVWRAECAPARG